MGGIASTIVVYDTRNLVHAFSYSSYLVYGVWDMGMVDNGAQAARILYFGLDTIIMMMFTESRLVY